MANPTWIIGNNPMAETPGWYVVYKRGLVSPVILKWYGSKSGSWERVTRFYGPIP